MIPDNKTQPPILFNPLKHHIQWVRELIQDYTKSDQEALISEFQKGSNLLCDYYFGSKSISEIITDTTAYLKSKNVFERVKFNQWIDESPGNYRNFQLNDGSEWTLLKGNQDEYFVHLHPARYSKNTIRVRFLALKTAILLKLFYNDDVPEIQTVNLIRTKYLLASPLHINGSFSHIQKAYEIFKRIPFLSSE